MIKVGSLPNTLLKMNIFFDLFCADVSRVELQFLCNRIDILEDAYLTQAENDVGEAIVPSGTINFQKGSVLNGNEAL
jgi:hypothetical protein